MLMSIIVYAGSMQFLAITLLTGGVSLINVAFMTLFVNVRHVFYGLSLIKEFSHFKRKKPYMVFSLTDETYSLLTTISVPSKYKKERYYFYLSLFNQSYWIIGSLVGSLIGTYINFNTKGLDFALTALFVVLFYEQFVSHKSKLPSFVGLVSTIVAVFIVSSNDVVLVSLILICISLFILRNKIEVKHHE
jgi:4-azaleucine resistance transporter AzlC